MGELPQRHSEFCEGHVTCPSTGRMECGKVMNWKVLIVALDDGSEELVEEPATVYCFGCGQTHNVKEE